MAAGAVIVGPLDRAAVERIALFVAVALLVARTSRWSREGLGSLVALRHEAARRLRARLEVERAVAKAVDEGIYAIDAAGKITFVNAAAERMLGFRARELIGKPMQRALHCSKLDGTCGGIETCRVLGVMRTGEPFRSEDDLFTRRDGTKFPIRYSSAPIRRGGQTVGAVVAFHDVTVERRASAREQFLAAASEQLACSIDFDETLARVARLALPFLGDWCMVVLAGDDGIARRVAVETYDPALAAAARGMLERYPIDLEAEHGVGRVLRTGASELLPQIEDFAGQAGKTAGERAALLAPIGLRSFLAVPLRARGRLVGVLDFAISGVERRFGAEDLAVAEDLATRCALALDNARPAPQGARGGPRARGHARGGVARPAHAARDHRCGRRGGPPDRLAARGRRARSCRGRDDRARRRADVPARRGPPRPRVDRRGAARDGARQRRAGGRGARCR